MENTKRSEYQAITDAKLSKVNQGFNAFFEDFNNTFKNSEISVTWEKQGTKLLFKGPDKKKLAAAMADFGFGGYTEEIRQVLYGTPRGYIEEILG